MILPKISVMNASYKRNNNAKIVINNNTRIELPTNFPKDNQVTFLNSGIAGLKNGNKA